MIIPTVIDKNNNGEYAFDLFSRLLKDRIIFICGEINDTTSHVVVSSLLYLDSLSHDDIQLYIESPGGSVSAGLSIYDTMQLIKSDVSTIGIGLCASMGSFLLSSGKHGKRYILPNTEVMIHEVIGTSSGQATNLEIDINHIINLKDKLNRLLAKNTNNSYKKICNDTKRDKYMDAKEALEYGIVDKIL